MNVFWILVLAFTFALDVMDIPSKLQTLIPGI
jgi:hypothetical protein